MQTEFLFPAKIKKLESLEIIRYLPRSNLRSLGPFVLIDKMGPAVISPNSQFDLGQHPHIGLSTLTYLFKGSVLHKDSTGAEQMIHPGDVNWMTAGKGVVHVEKSFPEFEKKNSFEIEGFQIWVALPKDKENVSASFNHIPSQQLPQWLEGSLKFKLIAGEAFGEKSPVPVFGPMYMIEIESLKDAEFDLREGLYGELGICLIKGKLFFRNDAINSKDLLYCSEPAQISIRLAAHSKILLFGGPKLTEPRRMDWNFVSTNEERIQEAIRKWISKDFEMIPGENSYMPYPQKSQKSK